jgi:hypothetical protein
MEGNMAPRVFHSFHYDEDCHRASQVRNIGAIDGNIPAQSNEWEQIKRAGDAAVQRWIDEQLKWRTCTIVLIGAYTATRPWVLYEIQRSWELKKGVFGIHIHNLRNLDGQQSSKGANPFAQVNLGQVASVYDPPSWDSKQVYGRIASNVTAWIENAVALRGRYQ